MKIAEYIQKCEEGCLPYPKCPFCGFEFEETEPYFTPESGGFTPGSQSNPPGGWVEGHLDCPECKSKIDFSDSWP